MNELIDLILRNYCRRFALNECDFGKTQWFSEFFVYRDFVHKLNVKMITNGAFLIMN